MLINKTLFLPIQKWDELERVQPILEDHILKEVEAGLASLQNAELWVEWGFKNRNSIMLFSGPSGTGKTTTAYWCARKLKMPIVTLSMGDIGGGDPGDTERNLKTMFREAKKARAILFLDECDSILWDRTKVGKDNLFMLGVINAILTGIEQYPYLVILATNFRHILDTALQRRITFEVEYSLPSERIRKKIWQVKWPKWPLSLSNDLLCNLAKYEFTGSDIYHCIQVEARFAINENRKPNANSLTLVCHQYAKNKNKITK